MQAQSTKNIMKNATQETLEQSTLVKSPTTTSYVQGSLVKMSQLLENVLDWLENEQDFGQNAEELLTTIVQSGLFLKTSLVYSRAIMGETLPPLFQKWSNSGMAFVGGYWTLNISEQLEQEEDCILLDILQTSEVPQKYYLDQTKSAQYYKKEKPEQILNRCALDGTVDLPLNDLDNVSLRKLTPIEQERLMGFPDNWTEGVSDNRRYRCLGNAVTTNVITTIAERLI